MLSSHSPPEIFDRRRRRALRERAGHRRNGSFLWQLVADELAERLADVTRTFSDILIVGPMTPYSAQILADRTGNILFAALSITECGRDQGSVIEEDRLPFDEASFDLIICAGTLDSVNDLPGALVQFRRCLRPDGLFLGHMFGAGTLSTLKAMLLAAEQNRPSPHIHPQIDLRTAADLLTRAGFALTVTDRDLTSVRYRKWQRLVEDLRDLGVGNALAGPRHYPGRDVIRKFNTYWAERLANGNAQEQFVHLYLSGWAPSSEQPKAAKRGSGKVSLASILPPSTSR